MKLVLHFSDPEASNHELSGGKGANLALLTQADFPVPVGFIVTAAAYGEFIQNATSLRSRIAGFDYHDAAKLQKQASTLRSEIEQIPLPVPVENAIREQLTGFPDDQPFSVRSSSTFEDLASAAFAGQHDTYLNIHGVEAILERIRACFASLWQDRAIAYRQQLGFDQLQATMAVVVQTMIPSEISGVGFTINPISGAIDEMLVNANFGLGESVVSGEGAIDQFVLARDGSLQSSVIGEKTQRIINSAQGTVEVMIDGDEANQVSMTTSQLVELAELMCRVEASYQFPQDIEWAISSGKLWLLQSRPITSIPPRWTRDESAERFPNVMTPLAWEMVEDGFHRSLNYSFQLMGYPAYSGKWFAMFDHYIYGNQNAVEIYGRRMPFTIRNLQDLEAVIPVLIKDYAWVQELPMEWSRDLDYYLLALGEFNAEDLRGKDLVQTWQFVLRVNQLGSDYFLPNIAISITQNTLYRLLHGLLQMLTGDPQEATALFDTLIAHTETKTGIVNKELAALAAEIRKSPALKALINSSNSRTLIESGRLAAFDSFAQRFKKFLRNHGHREVDFDPYQATWIEAPWLVLDNLRLMAEIEVREGDGAYRERKIKLAMHAAELALYSRIPPHLHFFFHEILRLVRTYTTLDDVEHYHTTRLTLPLRKGLRRLGEHLQIRGVIVEPMDVFFAHYQSLEHAILQDDPVLWAALRQSIGEEKAAYLQYRDRAPVWRLGDDQADAIGASLSGDVLSGLAGSAGVAEGQVYIIRSPDDFSDFPKGAVLVARTTNPAWTPLFYSACAVVTETGGPLSHGAVTAREMQIPAVMSVRGVMTRLVNGQQVRVDGRNGRVELIQT